MKDDDFVVVGYIEKEKGISLILAQYDHNALIYIGQVITSKQYLPKIQNSDIDLFDIEDVIWIKPPLIARVKFMERTQNNSAL